MNVNSFYSDKLLRIEIIFFVSYFLLFPIFSDIEFNLREPGGNTEAVIRSFPYRIVSGLLQMVPYLIYYKLLLELYLFRRKYLIFIISLSVFLLLLNSYIPLVNWFISILNLQGRNFHSAQGIDFSQAISFNFSVMYLLRELLVITALAFIIRSSKQEQRILHMQHKQLSSELNYLKVQLQPHFFFNTLNNIYSLVLQGSANAAPLIAKHADMMRFILYDASVATVKLSQDVEFLRNYVEVEKVRYSSRMDILFEVQGINEEAQIEPLLMLPFIENTFKHGLREETNKGFVHIIISLVGKELSAQITNSKSGETLNSTSGLGLENVRKRLEILYPGKHSLTIDETEMNYEVLLTITLRPW